MTRRQLVKDAIAHKPTARVPYCIDFTREARVKFEKETGCHSADEFLDNDIIQVAPPWWWWDNLGPDWKAMMPPDAPPGVKGNGSYPEFRDKLKLLRDHSDKYILVMIYGSHFEKANAARGIENFLADMAGDPGFAQNLLNRIIDRNMVMLENFLGCPEIDGVLLGSDWGTQLDLIMSPDTWEAMIRPGEQREYDLVHSYGKDVWVHSCGCITKAIPSLIEMGLDVLNPVQPECMDLDMLKREFGDKLTFWGGVSTQKHLPYGTPEEVRAETRRVRDLMAKDGGYILSPAQQLQTDVPVENILALIDVAKNG
ncbi:MAG: uroporphyrinogen decarboxylase family protein [Lentisphaeria bacterium]|nr:uroporphyrinogen decarboxylase family protein [Lentisphaeria bacterium]